MNERIRQLARQSTGASTIYMLEEEWLMFAELIVKECAKVAWHYTPDTEKLEYSHLIKDKILEHFGVEE